MTTGSEVKEKKEEVNEIKVQTITVEDVIDEDDPLFKEKEKKPIKVSKSFIFNTSCFVIFIGVLIFVYFQFVNKPKNEIHNLGGLSYKLDEKFVLTSENEGSRLYSFNNNGCDLRVTYGAASSDSYIESWFESIKDALTSAINDAKDKNIPIFSMGSLYMYKEVYENIKEMQKK